MNPSSLRRTSFAVCSSCDLLTAGAYPCCGTCAPLRFPAPPGLATGFAFQTSFRLRSLRPACDGSYTQILDLPWQNCLISDPHRPARAGGCDLLTTAWIKLAVACASAKNSRGLLTVTSLCFFRSTVSGFAVPCAVASARLIFTRRCYQRLADAVSSTAFGLRRLQLPVSWLRCVRFPGLTTKGVSTSQCRCLLYSLICCRSNRPLCNIGPD